jgi:hypothetical protein
LTQEGIKRGELIVHGYAQGLKNPAHGKLNLRFRQRRQRLADGAGQRLSGGE